MIRPQLMAMASRFRVGGLCWLLGLGSVPALGVEPPQSKAAAQWRVSDGQGHDLLLTQPLTRIVSLMPHATELLFEIGAGDTLIGAVNYSDYPEAAQEIPRVGGYNSLNIEAIVALNPELLIAWPEGNQSRELERLKALGLPLLVSDPKGFEDIAENLLMLGRLTGRRAQAQAQAARFRDDFLALRQRYGRGRSVSVFYQVWNAPLMTQNGDTFISRAIELCGGRNIYAELPMSNPQISVESLLQRDPEVIVASGMGQGRPEWLDHWRQYPSLRAVKANHLYYVPPQLLQRPTSRLLQGAELLCRAIDQARDGDLSR